MEVEGGSGTQVRVESAGEVSIRSWALQREVLRFDTGRKSVVRIGQRKRFDGEVLLDGWRGPVTSARPSRVAVHWAADRRWDGCEAALAGWLVRLECNRLMRELLSCV